MEKNVFDGIQKVQLKLHLEVLKECEKQFNTKFRKYFVFQIIVKEEDIISCSKIRSISDKMGVMPDQRQLIKVVVVAPKLGNFMLPILKITYTRTKLYPCKFYNALKNKTKRCRNSEKLDKRLNKLFASNSFRKPIKMLMAQME